MIRRQKDEDDAPVPTPAHVKRRWAGPTIVMTSTGNFLIHHRPEDSPPAKAPPAKETLATLFGGPGSRPSATRPRPAPADELGVEIVGADEFARLTGGTPTEPTPTPAPPEPEEPTAGLEPVAGEGLSLEGRLLAVLAMNGPTNTSQLAKVAGARWSDTLKALSMLVAGEVVTVEVGKRGAKTYRLAGAG